MKKSIRLFAVVIAIFMSFMMMTACGDDGSSESRETFILGFDASFPPYGYTDDNGNYVGFDIDLAKEVCERNNWEIKLQPINWDNKDSELNSGTIDCIWNGFSIQGREDAYTWTVPYVNNSQVVVVRKDSGINSLSDLAGKTVVVQAGSSALSTLTEEDNGLTWLTDSLKSLDQVPEYNTAFLNLESGAADAIAMDIGVAEYQVESRGENFVILDEILKAEEYGVGFKLGNTELRDTIQKTLEEMAEDGTFAEIAEQWGLTDSIVLGK